MATLHNTRTHAGHTISIRVSAPDGELSDVEIGRGQGLSARRSFGTDGVYQIGSIYPREHLPLRFAATVTLDRMLCRIDASAPDKIQKNLKDAGIAAVGTGEEDPDHLNQGGDIMFLPLIDIVVTDKFTGDVVRKYEGCTLVDYGETFRANAIAIENATFTCLRCA